VTHCDRVLALLSDGEPHDHHSLYALNVIAHSRVSELRKRGHTIEMWREDDLYFYRLLSEGQATPSASPFAEHAVPQVALGPLPPAACSTPVQPRLGGSGVKADPRVRRSGNCAQCGKPRKIPKPQHGVDPSVYERDPFCASDCARAWHGNPRATAIPTNTSEKRGRWERAA
jgi:hypothetical protein